MSRPRVHLLGDITKDFQGYPLDRVPPEPPRPVECPRVRNAIGTGVRGRCALDDGFARCADCARMEAERG
jgi:hypothetical protein